MADTAIAVTLLTADALSVRVDGTTPGAAMTSVSSGNTAVVACFGWTRNLAIIISGDGTHTATATIEAGDEPPSELSGLGPTGTLSVAATGTYILPVTAGKFIKNDHGDLEIPIAGTGPVYVGAVRLPQVS